MGLLLSETFQVIILVSEKKSNLKSNFKKRCFGVGEEYGGKIRKPNTINPMLLVGGNWENKQTNKQTEYIDKR